MTSQTAGAHTQEIEKLQARHEREIEALKLQQQATEKTGLKCIGYTSGGNSLGFHAYSQHVYENGVKSIADVKTILDNFIPSEKDNYVLTFAGRDNIQTESPFCLILHSSENLRPTAKLKYTDTNGVKISIELPVNLPIFRASMAQGTHKGFGRYESYHVISLTDANNLSLTMYSGGYKYYTGTAESFYKLLF